MKSKEMLDGTLFVVVISMIFSTSCVKPSAVCATQSIAAGSPPGRIPDESIAFYATNDPYHPVLLTWANPLIDGVPDTSVTGFYVGTGGSEWFIPWTTLYWLPYYTSPQEPGTTFAFWIVAANSYGRGPGVYHYITYYPTSLQVVTLTVYTDPSDGGFITYSSYQAYRNGQTIAGFGNPLTYPIMFQRAAPGYSFILGSWTSTGAVSIDGTTTPQVVYITAWWGNATLTAYFSGLMVDWWSQFHHDSQKTGYSTSPAPNTPDLIWQASWEDIRYGSYTGAVTYNKRVMATDRVGWIMSLNETTGNRIWIHTYGSAGAPNEITSTPATNGYLVFVVTCRDGVLHALSFNDGLETWSKVIGEGASGIYVPWYGSPAISKTHHKVVIGGAGPPTTLDEASVWAFDEYSGAVSWQYTENPGDFVSSPAIDEANGLVFVVNRATSGVHALISLDITTGNIRGRYNFGVSGTSASPTVADGKVYMPLVSGSISELYCFDTSLGLLWHRNANLPSMGAVSVAYGRVFTGRDCLNASNGDLIWHNAFADNQYSSPAVADGKVYVGSNGAGLYCLDATNGSLIWQFDAAGGSAWGSPAVSNGKVLFTTSGQSGLFAFVKPMVHDVAVLDVTCSDSGAYVRRYTEINITLKNEGNFGEVFPITLYFNSTLMDQSAVIMSPGESTVLHYDLWIPSWLAPGNFTIKAVVGIVSYETDTVDNVFVDGMVRVALIGDITGSTSGVPDGKVDVRDSFAVARAFDSSPGDPNWNPFADITGPTLGIPDNHVDFADIQFVARHYGEASP